MIKAVIFDMDGVLIDAKDWHYEAFNKALNLFGYNINRYEHLVNFDGLPTREKLNMLTMERGLSKGLYKFINDLKQKYTMEIIFSKCKPMFIHEYALSKLKNEGHKLAVASNAVKSSVEIMLKKSNLIKYLDFFLSNQDVEKSKPHPEMYNIAISKFKLNPKNCLIIEDNEHGVAAARASGAYVMRVNSVEEVTYSNIQKKIRRIQEEE